MWSLKSAEYWLVICDSSWMNLEMWEQCNKINKQSKKAHV